MKRRLLACAVAICLCAADAWANGAIHGTIWSSRGEAKRADLVRERAQQAEPPARGFFSFLSGSSNRKPVTLPANHTPGPLPPQPKRQAGITDAVVSLVQIPETIERRLQQQSKRDRSRPNPRMLISHSRYQPRVLAVPAGTRVEFQNLDRIWHSTFSVSSARRFDLGKLKPGAIDTMTMSRTGVINLHCDIHPEEIGFLVVTPNHAYARPDSLGHFTLPKLPPGTYSIEMWHPQRGSRKDVVVVPKRGDATCNLAF